MSNFKNNSSFPPEPFRILDEGKNVIESKELEGTCPKCECITRFRPLSNARATAEWIEEVKQDGLIVTVGKVFDLFKNLSSPKARTIACVRCGTRLQVCESCGCPNDDLPNRQVCDFCGVTVILIS